MLNCYTCVEVEVEVEVCGQTVMDSTMACPTHYHVLLWNAHIIISD
jgi:hypothetical protein